MYNDPHSDRTDNISRIVAEKTINLFCISNTVIERDSVSSLNNKSKNN